jgi:multiple sugar transport system permease protein
MQKKKKNEAKKDLLEEKTDVNQDKTDLLHENINGTEAQAESVQNETSLSVDKKTIKNEAKKNIKMKKRIGHEVRTNRWGYVFVLPFIIAFSIFNLWPTVNTFMISATDLKGLKEDFSFVSDCQICNGKGYTVRQTGYVIERNGKMFFIENIEADGESIDIESGEILDKDEGYLLVRIDDKYIIERAAGFSKERYIVYKENGKVIVECFGKKFIIVLLTNDEFIHDQDSVTTIKRTNDYTIFQNNDQFIVQNFKGTYIISQYTDNIGSIDISDIFENTGELIIEETVEEGEKYTVVFNGSIFIIEQPHEICNGTGRIVNFTRNYSKLFGFHRDPVNNEIKANDPNFWSALGNTFIIWGFNFAPQLGIALILAIWLSDTRLNLAGKGLFRTLIYMPNLLTAASVALLFRSFFGFNGYPVAPANQFLRAFDITAIDFFRSVSFSRGLVAFVQWWMWYGHTLIMLMAGITSIPISLYESATVDGANSRQTAWYITLPLLRPMMLYILITSMIGGMQMFDIPFLLTNGQGSPQFMIRTTAVYQYNMAFQGINDYAYGAAVSIGIFAVTIILAMLIYFFMQDRSDMKRKKGGAK